MNPRALVTAVKAHPNGAADVPFDALWQQLRDAFVSLTAGVAEAKALQARRAGRPAPAGAGAPAPGAVVPHPGGGGSHPHGAAVPGDGARHRPEAKAPAVDGVRLRLELARRRLQRAGVLERSA